jgi:hypothetical protein
MTTAAAVAWLERDYDQPSRFARPPFSSSHTPRDVFQVKPNHRGDCYCESGQGEIWTQADAAMKWGPG